MDSLPRVYCILLCPGTPADIRNDSQTKKPNNETARPGQVAPHKQKNIHSKHVVIAFTLPHEDPRRTHPQQHVPPAPIDNGHLNDCPVKHCRKKECHHVSAPPKPVQSNNGARALHTSKHPQSTRVGNRHKSVVAEHKSICKPRRVPSDAETDVADPMCQVNSPDPCEECTRKDLHSSCPPRDAPSTGCSTRAIAEEARPHAVPVSRGENDMLMSPPPLR